MIKSQPRLLQTQPLNVNWRQHFQTLSARLNTMRQKSQTRKELAALPKHLYHDLKLNDELVRKELSKSFWQ